MKRHAGELLCCLLLGATTGPLPAQTPPGDPPALSLQLQIAQQGWLTWPTSAPGFVLEELTALEPTNVWQLVPQSPELSGDWYRVSLRATNEQGYYRLRYQPGSELPPDPATVAPPLPADTATDVASATTFLYAGPNPIQTGVTSGTIQVQRAAVIRGSGQHRDGTALSGATVSVLGHPEFGQTLSRADGRFDLAVNGGSVLTVKCEKTGYLPAQRQASVLWQDNVEMPAMVLLPVDPVVTTVEFGAPTQTQIVQGSVQTDDRGARQATLLVPPGTAAALVLPNGTTQAVSSLSIRATEYTVGTNGPAAMPAELPPTSGYTYCVELSADEASTAGAQAVQFDKPVPFYLENFLGFPTGTHIPAAYYDKAKGTWVPWDDGRVIKVLRTDGGVAEVDTDGDETADDEARLTALGITLEERQKLAQLHPAGQSLWRVPVPHLTPWDFNLPVSPPLDAQRPVVQGLVSGMDRQGQRPSKYSWWGTVEMQNQVVQEAVPIVGTPFRLHYSSQRAAGFKALQQIHIPLSGSNLPASLKRIELVLQVAGRQIQQTFPAQTNQTAEFVWDGLDVYGRAVMGTQPLTVRIGYVYDGYYYYFAPPDARRSFGIPGGWLIPPGIPARREVTLWQEDSTALQAWDARGIGLGGWTLSIHHVFDPVGRVLHLGNGQWRLDPTTSIRTVAGGGNIAGGLGDGLPATEVILDSVYGGTHDLAVAPSGEVYVACWSTHRVRKFTPGGIIATAVGTGVRGSTGDGGSALNATLDYPSSVAFGPDGSLFIAEDYGRRVRRVGTDGIITAFAGNGGSEWDCTGDGGPATQARVGAIYGLAVGPDGSLYLVAHNWRVRKVSPDGIITTLAGNGVRGHGGDDGPATAAMLLAPMDVAVAPDGSIYIADSEAHRIRRVGVNGIITTVVNASGRCYDFQNCQGGYSGDGGPAIQAQLSQPWSIAFDRAGTLYISEHYNNRVRRVTTDGIITTVAGRGPSGVGPSGGDDGPATVAGLSNPLGVAVRGDGALFIGDSLRIRQVSLPSPGLGTSDIFVPSEEGRHVFQFNANGRHLRTLHALTGAALYEFAYDAAGRLAQVTDVDGNVTRIERDTQGAPVAIVPPLGPQTVLRVDAAGYLAQVEAATGQAMQYSYASGGLLVRAASQTDHAYSFAYDALGYVIEAGDPVGALSRLARMETAASHEVTLADSLDRTNRFTVDRSPNRDSRRAITFGDGTVAHVDSGADQRETNRLVSGAALAFNKGPDPRFGMLAPVPQTETVTLPSGLTSTSGTTRTAVLATPGAPLSLVAFTQTNTINGRAYTCAYEASNRVVTVTTPQGRQTVMRLDAAGRIIRQESVGLEPMQFTYDARGRLTEVAAGTGASARVARAEYNATGFLVATTDPAGRTTRFEHDAVGRVLAKVLPDGARIGFAYDAQGNLAVVRPPGRPDHVFAYNPVDLQTNYIPPSVDGATKPIQSVYDAARQLTEVTLPDDQRVSSSHDSAGRLTALSTPEGEYRYAYSASGALASIAAPSGINLTYGSDGSLLTSTVWSGAVTGAVTKVFDSNFWVSSVQINGEPPTPFSYDRDGFTTNTGSLLIERHPQHGQVTAATLGAVATTKQYNDFGELTGQTASFGASTLLAESYARDALGRITTKAETLDGATNTCDYAYDVGGRLAGVKKNGNTISAYTYDGNGNRLSHTDRDGAVVPGTYDDQDRLLQYGDAVYGYGANGDLSSKTVVGQTTTYRHDVFGNLLAVRLPDGTQIDYLMDGRNRRAAKKVQGVLVQGFLYLNALTPVAELDGDSRVVSVFGYGSRFNTPDCLIKSGVTYRIVADHLGSPRLVVNTETGAIVQRLDYDEFGRVLLDTNPGFQPFGFAGGLYDPATGLTRYGARDYDAETGRWTTKDPLLFAGLDGNLYRYAGGDPVNLADLTGLGAELFAAAMPDYLTFNVGYGPGSFSVTLDRYCRFYLGGGVSGAPTKLSVNANLSGGYLMGARAQSEDAPTPQQLSQFLTGHCVGGSLYSLFGGGIQHSPGGDTSLEFGVGFGGSIGDSYSVTPQEVADYAQQTGDHLGRLQMNLRHDNDTDASTYSGFGSFK